MMKREIKSATKRVGHWGQGSTLLQCPRFAGWQWGPSGLRLAIQLSSIPWTKQLIQVYTHHVITPVRCQLGTAEASPVLPTVCLLPLV